LVSFILLGILDKTETSITTYGSFGNFPAKARKVPSPPSSCIVLKNSKSAFGKWRKERPSREERDLEMSAFVRRYKGGFPCLGILIFRKHGKRPSFSLWNALERSLTIYIVGTMVSAIMSAQIQRKMRKRRIQRELRLTSIFMFRDDWEAFQKKHRIEGASKRLRELVTEDIQGN